MAASVSHRGARREAKPAELLQPAPSSWGQAVPQFPRPVGVEALRSLPGDGAGTPSPCASTLAVFGLAGNPLRLPERLSRSLSAPPIPPPFSEALLLGIRPFPTHLPGSWPNSGWLFRSTPGPHLILRIPHFPATDSIPRHWSRGTAGGRRGGNELIVRGLARRIGGQKQTAGRWD